MCNERKKKTCNEKYGVDNVFQSEDVKKKREETLLKNIGVNSPMKSEICWKKYKVTSRDRYGNDFYLQSDEGKEHYIQTCIDKYGVDWYSKSDEYKSRHDEIQKIINSSKRKNNTFNSSSIENKLSQYFTDENIVFIQNYNSNLYPFNCDFYLPKYDLYIEIQGTWTHGGHPFDKNNINDVNKLNDWKLKNSNYYDNAIETWTVRDVKKQETTKKNNLKYLEIFTNKINVLIHTIQDKFKELG